MHILLIGSGGREHALAWKIAQSPLLEKLFIAPGNGGTASLGENIALDVDDHSAVSDFCALLGIGLVVIGPEAPLVAGLADHLTAHGIPVFGPDKYGAQLEGSKDFTKEICTAAHIPTAAYRSFTDASAAKSYLSQHSLPVVLKADGLAAGKGVIIAETHAEAHAAVDTLMASDGHKKLVIEEFLTGEEASAFYICDGKKAVLIGTAQDHKRAYDGDRGPNTGGMGAYSPADILNGEVLARVEAEIITPTMTALKKAGHPYRGILYAGLMLTENGPKLIEYNCRFGDPECQALMLRLESDLVELMLEAAQGELASTPIRLDSRPAMTVIMAAKGYPRAYKKGDAIKGLEDAERCAGVTVFHAGTMRRGKEILSIGGRVLAISAIGSNFNQMHKCAYEGVAKIDWPGGFYRQDIGHRQLERLKSRG